MKSRRILPEEQNTALFLIERFNIAGLDHRPQQFGF
jgi:hypothetical protein